VENVFWYSGMAAGWGARTRLGDVSGGNVMKRIPAIVLSVCLLCAGAQAGLSLTDVSVLPTTITPASTVTFNMQFYCYAIHAFGYEYSQPIVAPTLTGNDITIEMGYFVEAADFGSDLDASVNLPFTLPAGSYSWLVRMWPGETMDPEWQDLCETQQGTLTVVPEPATLALLALGSLTLLRRRR
jgi:hypothetical protein